jgi:splicing factor 45
MDLDLSPGLPSSLPSRKGFAARIMSKYGWSAGTGLGASESGITSALSVQVSKRRRRPDAEGGGFAEPGGRGKIIAPKSLHGTKSAEEGAAAEEQGRFGKISQVIVLNGMLENMEDLRKEVEDGLGQEIGEECGEKYGRVERVYIDVEGRKVFIKFTDGVSALRAVNALDGRVFNGNTIVPGFWDVDQFEKGVYE